MRDKTRESKFWGVGFGNQSLKRSEPRTGKSDDEDLWRNWYQWKSKRLASHKLILWDRVSLLSTNAFNLMSRMAITWLCIYYKDPLCTVLNCARNFGNAAKEGLQGTTQWVAYYFKSKVLVSCTRICHDRFGPSGIQMLSPVPIAPKKNRKWGTERKHLV